MDNNYLLQSRRSEYLKKFQKTTTHLFIEGVYSIYNNVKKNNKSKRLLLKEFQQSMVDVSRWSQDIITTEHQRFKKQSPVLDRLIRGIFDLDIVIKKDLCKNAEDFIPQPWDFVHQCYLNIARALWKQPFLLYDVNIDKLTIQQNKLRIEKIVYLCIQDTFTQYIRLDIEHDDVSNVDYTVQHSNLDIVLEEHDQKNLESYGDNNDIICRDEDDVGTVFMSPCNDNFKELDYEVNKSLHETISLDGTQNHDHIQSDNDFEEYVNVDDGVSDDVLELDDENKSIEKEDDIVMSDVEDIEDIEDIDDAYETKSFHSEEVGDVDSVKSEELFVSRVDTESEIHDNNNILHHDDNKIHHDDNIIHYNEEIKNIFIGERNRDELVNEKEINHDTLLEMSPDIKVVTIDDNKVRLMSRKDALLNIKKKVKSSMHHSKELENSRYERYGDRLRVERKNMSFF